jgi:hypothetical protein
MAATTWDEVRAHCAEVQRERLRPEVIRELFQNLPQLDPPSTEQGVSRDGETGKPMTVEQHQAKVAANRERSTRA